MLVRVCVCVYVKDQPICFVLLLIRHRFTWSQGSEKGFIQSEDCDFPGDDLRR
jgi:hypothetical protein